MQPTTHKILIFGSGVIGSASGGLLTKSEELNPEILNEF